MSFPLPELDIKAQQRLSLYEELEADRTNILKNSTAKTFELPDIFKFEFDKSDRRWNKKDSDITDYFNYGYNEETWRLYVNKVRRLALKLNPTEYRVNSESIPPFQRLNELDDGFPIDLGGFSAPFFKDLFTGITEDTFFDDKVLKHCMSRKKYGSLDYDNISLDHYLNYFLNYTQKTPGSQNFEKLLKTIRNKNQEHSEDIYQAKKHLEAKAKGLDLGGKNKLIPPPWNPFLNINMRPPLHQFHPMGFPPFMNPSTPLMHPLMKPPLTQLPFMNFDFNKLTMGLPIIPPNNEPLKRPEKERKHEKNEQNTSKNRFF